MGRGGAPILDGATLGPVRPFRSFFPPGCLPVFALHSKGIAASVSHVLFWHSVSPDKIEEFEQSQRGLWHYNKAHADLGRMLNEQAEEKAQKNRVGCRGCHYLFQAKGFSRHLKYCKHQVVE